LDPEHTDRAVRARADLITALVLVAVGLAVIYLSWTMPRLEARRIHPATIPGLVPFILGSALVLTSGLLAVRSWRADAGGGWQGLARILVGPEARRALVALALMLIYALLMVGKMPFAVASAIFIFVFTFTFEVVLTRPAPNVLRSALWALGIALVAGFGIAYVFEEIFLVRLP
jgi:hypothetical protein